MNNKLIQGLYIPLELLWYRFIETTICCYGSDTRDCSKFHHWWTDPLIDGYALYLHIAAFHLLSSSSIVVFDDLESFRVSRAWRRAPRRRWPRGVIPLPWVWFCYQWCLLMAKDGLHFRYGGVENIYYYLIRIIQRGGQLPPSPIILPIPKHTNIYTTTGAADY